MIFKKGAREELPKTMEDKEKELDKKSYLGMFKSVKEISYIQLFLAVIAIVVTILVKVAVLDSTKHPATPTETGLCYAGIAILFGLVIASWIGGIFMSKGLEKAMNVTEEQRDEIKFTFIISILNLLTFNIVFAAWSHVIWKHYHFKNRKPVDIFRDFRDKHFKMTIYEITLAGILLGLHLISAKFISINLSGLMRVGITFVFMMCYGLIFGPVKGVFIALIADNFTILMGPGFGQWMWEYAIIPVGIVLMTCSFKHLFKADGWLWWTTMILLNILVVAGIVVTVSVNHHFTFRRQFDQSVDYAIYAMAGVLAVLQIGLFTAFKITKNKDLKQILSIGTLIFLIIVVWIWIWGPIAYIHWLQHFGRHKATPGYYSFNAYYKTALIPRILKTPIIAPIYTLLIVPIYKSVQLVGRKVGWENKY